MDFLFFAFLVLPQTEITWLSHLPGCNQQDLKIQPKPCFKRSFEVILDNFVKPKDTDPESGSFSDLCFFLPLMGFSLGSEPLPALPGWHIALHRGAAVGSRTVPPFLQHSQSSLNVPRKRPRHCAALPAPLWQGFLLFFCHSFIDQKLFRVGMVNLLSVHCPLWDFRHHRCHVVASFVLTR